ncbi:MAG: ABC transporter permease [Bacillota bacterium]
MQLMTEGVAMPERKTLHALIKGFQWKSLDEVLSSCLGIVAGLLMTAVIMALLGVDPIAAYSAMFSGALGGAAQWSFTLLKAVPLAFAGLGVTLAYRAGIFNIGVEGQIYIAALFSSMTALFFPQLPGGLLLPLSLAVGMLFSGAYALIPAILKVKRGLSEVLTTMLLNYIAIYIVGVAVNSFLKMPGQDQPRSNMLPEQAWLPMTGEKSYLHIGVYFVLVIAVILWFVLFRSSTGYKIRSIGFNLQASVYGGMKVNKILLWTMFMSGAIGGLAGSTAILGLQHRLLSNFMLNYGYEGIPVALLGGLNPVGVLFTAFFFGILKSGGEAIQITMGIPVSAISIINGFAIISILMMTQIRKRYIQPKRRNS